MQKRLVLWIGSALALTTVLVWGLARGLRSSEAPRASAPPTLHAKADDRDPRQRQVLELVRKGNDPKAWTELVALYGRLAGDASALGVRTSVLNALFSEPALPMRLKRVLDAVEADSTPAPQDPLWPQLVNQLAQEWTPEVFQKGRDLMLMEKRSRARRALIASFTELATSERAADLPTEQSQALLTDLIDMHAQADVDQRPQIQHAVRKLGGNDPADLLAGIGLTGGKKLELQAEYERNLQAGIDSLTKGQAASAD